MMGSGKVIISAIRKYGIDNFVKTILETFDTAEAMFAREKEIVNAEFLLREDTYNLRRSGSGGFDFINNDTDLVQRRNKWTANNRNFSNQLAKIKIVKKTETYRKNMSAAKQKYFDNNPGTFTGKSHSNESKEKISEANKGKGLGEKNSQFGSIWITNGEENKKVNKESNIPDGWHTGRKLKI